MLTGDKTLLIIVVASFAKLQAVFFTTFKKTRAEIVLSQLQGITQGKLIILLMICSDNHRQIDTMFLNSPSDAVESNDQRWRHHRSNWLITSGLDNHYVQAVSCSRQSKEVLASQSTFSFISLPREQVWRQNACCFVQSTLADVSWLMSWLLFRFRKVSQNHGTKLLQHKTKTVFVI